MKDSVDQHVATWSRELQWMDPLKEAIFMRMNLLVRHAAQNRRSALVADDMRLWQYKVLLMLRRVGHPYQASPSELAAMLGLTRGALSARLGVLEQAGLIARDHAAADRRRVRVTLTDAGHRAFESTVRQEEHGEGELLSVLTKSEKQTLANLLRKVVLALEAGTDSR